MSSADFYQVSVFCLFLLYVCAIRIIVFFSVQFERFPLFCVISFLILPYEFYCVEFYCVLFDSFSASFIFFINLFLFFLCDKYSQNVLFFIKKGHSGQSTTTRATHQDDEIRRTRIKPTDKEEASETDHKRKMKLSEFA